VLGRGQTKGGRKASRKGGKIDRSLEKGYQGGLRVENLRVVGKRHNSRSVAGRKEEIAEVLINGVRSGNRDKPKPKQARKAGILGIETMWAKGRRLSNGGEGKGSESLVGAAADAITPAESEDHQGNKNEEKKGKFNGEKGPERKGTKGPRNADKQGETVRKKSQVRRTVKKEDWPRRSELTNPIKMPRKSK